MRRYHFDFIICAAFFALALFAKGQWDFVAGSCVSMGALCWSIGCWNMWGGK